MSDSPIRSDCFGHICIFLEEGEMHADLPLPDEPMTSNEIAEAIGETIALFIQQFYKEVENDAHARPASIQ